VLSFFLFLSVSRALSRLVSSRLHRSALAFAEPLSATPLSMSLARLLSIPLAFPPSYLGRQSPFAAAIQATLRFTSGSTISTWELTWPARDRALCSTSNLLTCMRCARRPLGTAAGRAVGRLSSGRDFLVRDGWHEGAAGLALAAPSECSCESAFLAAAAQDSRACKVRPLVAR
jgi:hypothetical protein